MFHVPSDSLQLSSCVPGVQSALTLLPTFHPACSPVPQVAACVASEADLASLAAFCERATCLQGDGNSEFVLQNSTGTCSIFSVTSCVEQATTLRFLPECDASDWSTAYRVDATPPVVENWSSRVNGDVDDMEITIELSESVSVVDDAAWSLSNGQVLQVCRSHLERPASMPYIGAQARSLLSTPDVQRGGR